MLEKYVFGDEIRIDAEDWERLKGEYPGKEGKDLLRDELARVASQLPFPKTATSLEDAKMDLWRLLQLPKDYLIVEDKFKCRDNYDHIGKITRFVRQDHLGSQASNYFFYMARMDTPFDKAPAPTEIWKNPKRLSQAFNAIWNFDVEGISMSQLRTAIGLRYHFCSQFRPSAARTMYMHFNAKRILDSSAGWGDRCVAAIDYDQYLGVDPNPRLIPLYKEMLHAYRRVIQGKVEIIHEPYEDAEIPYTGFDMLFTSPPYFNKEKYDTSETQSWKRYKTSERWLEGFMYPLVIKSRKALKDGGIMAINIANVKSETKKKGEEKRYTDICTPMHEYILGNGFELVEVMGLELSLTPNSCEREVGVTFGEPIFIYRKV